MARPTLREQQTHRDIERARTLVSEVRGISPGEAAEALTGRAAEVRVSLHAAALAVLATSPTDELLTDEVPTPLHPGAVATEVVIMRGGGPGRPETG